MNSNTLKDTEHRPPPKDRYLRKPTARPMYSKSPVLAREEVLAVRARGMINLDEAQKIAAYGLRTKQMAYDKGKIKVS